MSQTKSELPCEMNNASAIPSTSSKTAVRDDLNGERILRQSIEVTASRKPQIAKKVELAKNESRYKRIVFDTICELSDPISGERMIEKLHLLDTASWNEIIEERFLGRLCGYPPCPENIHVDFSRRYIINNFSNKIYATNSEENKFCSVRCRMTARAIRTQLDRAPLWVTGARSPDVRNFVIPDDAARFLADNASEDATKRYKNGTDNVSDLVLHIEDLYVADCEPEDEDKDEFVRDPDSDTDQQERDEREFLRSIKANAIKRS